MSDFLTFAEAIDASRSLRRSILLGNGFSLAQDPNRFSYSALLEKSGLEDAGSRYRFTSSTLCVLDIENWVPSLRYRMPPTGTVSFVFTDIEGSATLWERHPDAMKLALARHNAVLREVISAHSGFIFKTVGDAFCAAFATASDALAAATAAQRIMQAEDWRDTPIKIRIGLHTGAAEERDGDYFGNTVNRVARVMSVAYGQQILLSTATAELLRDQLPGGLTLREMGEHRLKGLINPERLWQVVAPGLRQDFPALQSLNAIPNNLPLRSTSFLGRDQDVSQVRDLLETTNLLTLVGPGGIGKTSLSLQVAASVLDRFKDGAWFVELAPLADAALVPSAVATALGLREEPDKPLLTTLRDFLSQRQLLIILDNCEHLVEACAHFADSVLRTSHATRILASSREPLTISGELAWRVSPLPTPDPKAQTSILQLTQFAAVRLFIERARFANASFQVTNDNAPSVSQICWQLDGVPLAIELAASRVKAMRVEQIAERLGDRFRLLTGGSRTALPRHQTLRATIAWSYDLLSDRERILFRRLSIFAGGWTLEAAEDVCVGHDLESYDVLDLLTHLVDKSLIVPDEKADEPRYRMLETIRQYSREKLVDANEVEQIGDRHLTFFTRQAEWLGPRFQGPDQIRWYAKAEVELDNLRTALEHSLSPTRVGNGMRMGRSLHRYWVARVYWREANGWLKRLLAVSGTEDGTPLRARTLFVIGHITNYYDSTQARNFAEESLRLARSLDYKEGIVDALWLMGWLDYPKLDGSAAPYFEESIELARSIDHVFGAVHAYAWYGVYKIGVGDYEGAKLALREGMVQAERLGDYFAKKWTPREGTLHAERIGGDPTLLGRCAGNLGLVAMLQGDFVEAKSYLDQSLALVRGAGNRNSIAESLWLQGRLALCQSDFDPALHYLKESLALYRTYTTSMWVTRDLVYIAILHVARDEFTIAARLVGALDARDKALASIDAHLGSLASIAEYRSAVEKLRAGMPAAAFDAEWKAGHGLTVEQSIELALS
jgi:predicted ATPase/class 3 adenylate cyclase/tetratricopeptide (TPR) repeat protein